MKLYTALITKNFKFVDQYQANNLKTLLGMIADADYDADAFDWIAINVED